MSETQIEEARARNRKSQRASRQRRRQLEVKFALRTDI